MKLKKDNLSGLLSPKSIAVVGASDTPGKIGNSVMQNLVDSHFKGKIYPINPKAETIMGFDAFPSVLDVPGPIDTAVFAIPAKLVPKGVEECGLKGVKGIILITSGFSEVGNRELELEVVETAYRHNVRILGPNIVGVLSNSNNMNASFAPVLPLPGKAALVSQSGALLIAIDMATFTRKVGFDKLISIGNMSDVNFADLVTWLDGDRNISTISLYIEGIKDGRSFIEASQKATKPIVALKAGVSAHGAAAAASHTGSLAGAAKVYGAAFGQAGIVQASDLNNLFDRTLALSLQPPMKGENILIITNGGGVGVLATDAAERCGLPLKFAPDEVQTELKKHMPEFGSAKNPADLTGVATAEWYHNAIKGCLPNRWVDGLTVLYCEVTITEPMDVARAIREAVTEANVPKKPVTVSFIGGEKSEEAMQWMVEQGIPAYAAPDTAINAMAALREYARIKEDSDDEPLSPPAGFRQKALEIIALAREDDRSSLTEIEAKEIFKLYGMPVTQNYLARTEEEVVEYANEIGYPIVMKIVSPDILHKSDAGGVKVNVRTDDEARKAYNAILSNAKEYKPNAKIHGVIVQEMAPWGTEVILGSINDATFGPTIMFGLGGIFVEVLKDVTFRVTPVSHTQAWRMLDEIRSSAILAGVRGELPRDREVLANTISKYSAMILDLADEISESDANPILVYEEGRGVKVVDARMILKSK
jgi:acetate---CoA ligase (ADP-forming)